MSTLLMVAAVVVLAITTLIGFDVFDASHLLGWISLGLLLWALAVLIGGAGEYVKRIRS